MIGTVHSVPRLMPGQGFIIGVGTIAYPAEYEGADPQTDRPARGEQGRSRSRAPTTTASSAAPESGEFLRWMHQLPARRRRLLRRDLPELRRAVRAGALEHRRQPARRRDHRVREGRQRPPARQHVPGARAPHREPRPARPAPAAHAPRARRQPLRPDDLGPRPRVPGRRARLRQPRPQDAAAARHPRHPARRVLAHDRRRVHAHPGAGAEGVDPGAGRDAADPARSATSSAGSSSGSTRPRRTRASSTPSTWARSASASRAPRASSRCSTRCSATPPNAGMAEVVLGTAHRGRLNVLVNTIGKSYGQIFREFEGALDPASVQGSGDVKYHVGSAGTHTAPSGRKIVVTLASNPSHLEAVDPVVEGMARAKEDRRGDTTTRSQVLPVLVHGDAAFAGQGVVAETLNLSEVPGYEVGGTVHVVVNNQLGFTTAPELGRSSVYATDVAKMVQAPIFHVNGDDPEACVRVIELAFAFRQAFRKDVVVDMVCYRRFGHNEADEPAFTQPKMYELIRAHRSVRKLYTETLVNRGDLSLTGGRGRARRLPRPPDPRASRRRTRARRPSRGSTRSSPRRSRRHRRPAWSARRSTAIVRRARHVARRLPREPEAREDPARPGAPSSTPTHVDWALAEALAFGSLVLEGTPVRLAGQDTRRGTFSQRHGVLVDTNTENEYFPLAHIAAEPGAVHALRLGALGVRRARLRVRLLGRRPAGVGRLGGAVRRLHERRADHHRPVHRRGRGQVGPELEPHAAAPPRLRGSGPRALERAHRALPRARAPRTTCGSSTRRPRRSTSTCCGASHGASTRKPLICFTPKRYLRMPQTRSPVDELTDRRVPRDARRSVRRRSTRRRCGACCCAPARSATS